MSVRAVDEGVLMVQDVLSKILKEPLREDLSDNQALLIKAAQSNLEEFQRQRDQG